MWEAIPVQDRLNLMSMYKQAYPNFTYRDMRNHFNQPTNNINLKSPQLESENDDNKGLYLKDYNDPTGLTKEYGYTIPITKKLGVDVATDISQDMYKGNIKNEPYIGLSYSKKFANGGQTIDNPNGITNTQLTPGQEIAYQQYIKNNKIEESNDYDMRGYWKEEGFKSPTHSGHFDDTYKKLDYNPFPTEELEGDNYPRISEGSKYSGNPNYRTSYGNKTSPNTSFDKRGQGFWNDNDEFIPW